MKESRGQQLKEPYILRISAQKGGVGKTTIAVNLAVELRLRGYSVLLADADSSNPAIGMHLGMESAAVGFTDLLNGKAKLRNIVIIHPPSGLAVISNHISKPSFFMTEKQVEQGYKELTNSDYDIVIVDTQPGYFPDIVAKNIDDTLIITNPDMPSYTSALRLSEYFNSLKLKHSLVVNRISGRKYEISNRELKDTYDGQICIFVPEDEIVPVSIAAKIPACIMNPKAKFSRSVFHLADFVEASAGLQRTNQPDYSKPIKRKRFFKFKG